MDLDYGFYWVKKNDEWIIADYKGRGQWFTIAVGYFHNSSEFECIGEKIECGGGVLKRDNESCNISDVNNRRELLGVLADKILSELGAELSRISKEELIKIMSPNSY
ncbi:MAG: hypothetical protein ACEPOW_13985 [Bacteroidales bacterium]